MPRTTYQRWVVYTVDAISSVSLSQFRKWGFPRHRLTNHNLTSSDHTDQTKLVRELCKCSKLSSIRKRLNLPTVLLDKYCLFVSLVHILANPLPGFPVKSLSCRFLPRYVYKHMPYCDYKSLLKKLPYLVQIQSSEILAALASTMGTIIRSSYEKLTHRIFPITQNLRRIWYTELLYQMGIKERLLVPTFSGKRRKIWIYIYTFDRFTVTCRMPIPRINCLSRRVFLFCRLRSCRQSSPVSSQLR